MKTYLVKIKTEAGHLFIFNALGSDSWQVLEEAAEQYGPAAITVTLQ